MVRKYWKLMLGIIIISVPLILTACNNEPTDEEETEVEIPVELTKVEQNDFTYVRTYVARTMPNDFTPVLLQSPGQVEEVFVNKGDEVKEGDKIAEVLTQQGFRINVEAPKDGIIQELNLKEEQLASNEQPAAVIVQVDPLLLTFNVPSNEVNKFKVGDKINFNSSQLDVEGEATITYVAKTAGDTGMFAIEAEVRNSKLLAGITVQIEVEEVLYENALIVPTEAVVEQTNETVVFTVKDGIATEVKVEVLEMQTKRTAIKVLEGELDANSEVITRGQLTITDGQKVRLTGEGQ